MRYKAQSLFEFAVILISVTAVAIVTLQLISNKINSSVYTEEPQEEQVQAENNSNIEEDNCTKLGLSWDKKNGVCEAK